MGENRTFSGVPYSGDLVTDHPYWGSTGVVFDLSSIQYNAKTPALLGHDPEKIAGVASLSHTADSMSVTGSLFSTASGKEIAETADQDFPWQMSIFIVPSSVEKLKKPEVINGRTFNAGVAVFRGGRVREVSFTPVGADHRTSANVFSMSVPFTDTEPSQKPKESTVTPEEQKVLQDRLAALETQFSAAAGQLTALKTSNELLTKQLEDERARFAAEQKNARKPEIEKLFSAMGADYTDEAAKPYFDMDAGSFALVMGTVNKVNSNIPQSLFTSITPAAVVPEAKQQQFNAAIDDAFSGKMN